MKTGMTTVGLVLGAVCAGAQAGLDVAAEARAAAQELEIRDALGDLSASTRDDRTSVAVTVYNNNLALVRETRRVRLVPGEQDLKFMDVAEQIKPETVSLRSLSDPGKLSILEQNYEFDLISPEKLMEKYIGKDVRLINKNTEVGFTELKAKLISTNSGPVYEIDGDIYLGHPGNVVLPKMPDNLISKPTLVWKLDNHGTDHEVEVAYQTTGISWAADYVLTYREQEGKLDLEGWVTLNNQSGATYEDALLKVVAGEVNIAPQAKAGFGMDMVMAERAMAAPAPMQQEAFAEYHLYTLPRKTTIRQNQSKQVSLLSGEGIAAKKTYEFRGQEYFYVSRQADYPVQHPQAFITFENREENQLGVPLPGGIMRVYQPDQSGALQFAGEDRIEHTAKDEEVRLLLGEAFDLVAERKQTDYKVLTTDRVWEAAFEIKVRNHKDIPVTVKVFEPLGGNWEIRESSIPHTKEDAFTASFAVDVPADGETVLTYRYRVTR
jgi:hypothetical protein